MNKTSPFKSALQDGVCERVRAYAVEIKPGTLRVSLMYAFGRAYGLPYKMATFIAAKGLFNIRSIRETGAMLFFTLLKIPCLCLMITFPLPVAP